MEIEACSSGGGRVDLGILRLTDEVWPSDNTDPSDRLSMQYGFSYAYAPAVMMSWVTGSPNWVNGRKTSLDFRFLVSMQGGLGIGADITRWTPEQIATAQHYIKAYKAIRPTVQRGRLYLLLSPLERAPSAATESVAVDGSQAVLFAYLRTAQEAVPYPVLHLQGLDPDARYAWHAIHGTVADGTPKAASGAYWMHHGIQLQLRHDMSAAGIVFDRVDATTIH